MARQRCRFIAVAAVFPPLAQTIRCRATAKARTGVQALQKRNAQLESEISGLKKTQNAFAGPPPPEGKMKTGDDE